MKVVAGIDVGKRELVVSVSGGANTALYEPGRGHQGFTGVASGRGGDAGGV